MSALTKHDYEARLRNAEEEITKVGQERDELIEAKRQYAERIEELHKAIVEQRETIVALNSTLGGHGSLTTSNMNRIAQVEKERDELAAQVEVMRYAVVKHLGYYPPPFGGTKELHNALSIAGPDALREVQARTLEDAALLKMNEEEVVAFKLRGVVGVLQVRAAAKRKGE